MKLSLPSRARLTLTLRVDFSFGELPLLGFGAARFCAGFWIHPDRSRTCERILSLLSVLRAGVRAQHFLSNKTRRD